MHQLNNSSNHIIKNLLEKYMQPFEETGFPLRAEENCVDFDDIFYQKNYTAIKLNDSIETSKAN